VFVLNLILNLNLNFYLLRTTPGSVRESSGRTPACVLDDCRASAVTRRNVTGLLAVFADLVVLVKVNDLGVLPAVNAVEVKQFSVGERDESVLHLVGGPAHECEGSPVEYARVGV